MKPIRNAAVALLMTGLAVVVHGSLLGNNPQAAPAPAQTQPVKKQPVAKTRAEYDAYQKFWAESDADKKISNAEEFLKAYPETELKIYAFQAEMQSYQVKNDFTHMRQFGEQILEIDPNDIPTLIVLATALPERTQDTDLDKDQKRAAAESYAKRALEQIDKLGKPAGADAAQAAQWEERINDARSQAHYALGLVALQRKSYPQAVDEIALAAKLESPSQPDPILYWRLGLANELNKKDDEALKAYEKSVSLGGVKIGGKDQAVEDRDRLKKRLADTSKK
jgi:tetratricopeptide (TPR) repeat protein